MIRQANEFDVPQLLNLAKQMHTESIFARFNFDDEKVIRFIKYLINSPTGIALVAEADGDLQGGFFGAIQEHYFGTDLQAFDYALFLDPRYRKGTMAARLIKAYVAEALNKGAKQVMLANTTGVQPERVASLFKSLGFRQLGYVFELPQVAE